MRRTTAAGRRLRGAGLALLWLAAACGEPPESVPEPAAFTAEDARRAAAGRDVLLLTLDTTRFDHLGCYGYERDTSPTLDALAAAGVRFERAYAATPITLPSHASLLTGLSPPRHGVRNNGTYVLGGGVPTLAESLRAAGYATAAFVSARVLEARYGLARGFDHYDDDLAAAERQTPFAVLSRPAASTVERALAWLGRRPGQEPVFLWLHFFDPHAPYTPPRDQRALFGETVTDRYDGEIRAMDEAIGELLRGLEALGRRPVIAVVADHGEGLGEHGEATHGALLYEETMRIPFLLGGEGIFPPTVSAALARHVDLLPTVLDLLGLPLPGGLGPEDLDGRSLLPSLERSEGAVEAGEETSPPVYLETLLPFEDYGWSPLHAVVEGAHKLIRAPAPELYDLAADPAEEHNLFADERRRAARLAAILEEAAARDGEAEAARRAVDDEERARLLALGYGGGGSLAEPGDDLPNPRERIEVLGRIERAESLLSGAAEGAGGAVTQNGRDPVAAFEILAAIVEANPGNARALNLLAYEPLRELAANPQDPNRPRYLAFARRAFDVFAARAPQRPDAEYGYGLIEEMSGDQAAADARFARALEAHPEHLPLLRAGLRGAVRREELQHALDLAERLLRVEPGDYEGRYTRALVRFQLGSLAEAEAEFHELYPGRNAVEESILSFWLGEAARRQGRCPEALQHYARVRIPQIRAAQNVDRLEAECRSKP